MYEMKIRLRYVAIYNFVCILLIYIDQFPVFQVNITTFNYVCIQDILYFLLTIKYNDVIRNKKDGFKRLKMAKDYKYACERYQFYSDRK